MNGRRVVFVGDSSTRQLYWAAGRRLDHIQTEIALLEDFNSPKTKQKNIDMELEDVRLEFIWDPWLNSTDYHKSLAEFREVPEFSDVGSMKEVQESPALLVLGAPGHWAARHGGSAYLDLFQSAVDTAKPHLSQPLTLPSVGRNGISFSDLPNRILLVPVQTPWYDELVPDRRDTITSDKIVAMNNYLRKAQVAEQSRVLWSFEVMTDKIYESYEETGLHVVDGVADRRLDVLLGARCTAAWAVHDRHHKYTCCVAYPSLSWAQLVFLVASVGFTVSVFLKSRRDPGIRLAGTGSAGAIAALVLISIYSYIADRTHAFPKTSVNHSVASVLVKVFAFMVVSLLSFKKQKGAVIGSKLPQPADREFMPREVSDEAKGIIQGLFLIGSYHDILEEDWAYKIMRFLVAVYIYLSAYGHATYFLSTGDFSFRRVAKVLTRLNILGMLEAFALNGTWSFYHFLPTISFWFIVTYATLAIGKRLNDNATGVVLKVVASSLVFTTIIKKQFALGLLEKLVSIILRASWDSGTFKTHLADDRYVAYMGIMTANIAHQFNVQRRQTTRHQTWIGGREKSRQGLSSPVTRLVSEINAKPAVWAFFKAITIAVAGAAFFVYNIIVHSAIHNRADFDRLHPHISLGPVIAYAVIRNILEMFRRCHLRVPRVLGRMCLATYILHHHIWLAGGGTTILRMGLVKRGLLGGMSRIVEEVLLTLVFLWISSSAKKATIEFVAWLVGEEATQDPPSHDNGGLVDPGMSVSMPRVTVTDVEVSGRLTGLAVLAWLANILR